MNVSVPLIGWLYLEWKIEISWKIDNIMNFVWNINVDLSPEIMYDGIVNYISASTIL